MDNFLTKIERGVMQTIGLLIALLTLSAALNRYVLTFFRMPWYEEIVVALYMMLIFWGASRAAREGSHLRLDLLESKLKNISKKGSFVYMAFINFICLTTSIYGTYYLTKFSLMSTRETPILHIPYILILFLTLVAGFLGLTLRYLTNLITTFRDEKRGKEDTKCWAR